MATKSNQAPTPEPSAKHKLSQNHPRPPRQSVLGVTNSHKIAPGPSARASCGHKRSQIRTRPLHQSLLRATHGYKIACGPNAKAFWGSQSVTKPHQAPMTKLSAGHKQTQHRTRPHRQSFLQVTDCLQLAPGPNGKTFCWSQMFTNSHQAPTAKLYAGSHTVTESHQPPLPRLSESHKR